MAGPRLIGRTVPEVAGKALGKKGLAFGALITDWPSIVGHQLSLRTAPDKLVFPRGKREDATLHVRAMGAIALELQHLEPLIVEKINGFFGYRAVSRLKLVHAAPVTAPARRAPVPRTLTMDEEIDLVTATAAIEDEGLRDALERFGRSLMGRKQR
ncbi:MAG TPA: DciA family protein [Azospirillum sp.]|nr:DciA family protein [Azospirillum sp.]